MPKKEAVPVVQISVVTINTCSSLSGRSELTYHVGCNADGDIHFRVAANTGSGQFNADWVALSLIDKLLSEHPATKPMTSGALRTVFRHRSSNSPAFLFAALMAEGLVKASTEKDLGYLLGDIEVYKQAISALSASDTNLDVFAANPEPAKRNARRANCQEP